MKRRERERGPDDGPRQTPLDEAFLEAWNRLNATGKDLGTGPAYGQKQRRSAELALDGLDLDPDDVIRALDTLIDHLAAELAENPVPPAEAFPLLIKTAGFLGVVAGYLVKAGE